MMCLAHTQRLRTRGNVTPRCFGGSSSPCGVRKEHPLTPNKHKRLRKKRFWRKKKSSKKFACVLPCVSLSELTRRAECEAITDLVNNISAKSATNLVNLLGYSTDLDQRILVYEYMPNSSLEDHLLDLPANAKALAWQTRMKIAVGAAKGIEYLHEVANPPVIYRDLKASTSSWTRTSTPSSPTSGLAKLGPVGDQSHVSTRVMGTYGYCAPEYAMTGKLTKMSDIYSFGVVLLELITGRRAIDPTRPTEEQILIHWAAPLIRDRKMFVRLADPLLGKDFPVKGCTRRSPSPPCACRRIPARGPRSATSWTRSPSSPNRNTILNGTGKLLRRRAERGTAALLLPKRTWFLRSKPILK
ncbi:hypothetical protein ZWY2020_019715 [Hordeum vulgare]|nr:hypothetical protein ZWY2020_019715 [Hordeum vulgare]